MNKGKFRTKPVVVEAVLRGGAVIAGKREDGDE